MDSEYNLERYLSISNYIERKTAYSKRIILTDAINALAYDELSIHVQALLIVR